ncbi:MAG: SpoIIE family protein phosphatase [Planctomycetes bacterium]|nr:SpoIIE family protein phosphatase [Planctomycetota bacterium]
MAWFSWKRRVDGTAEVAPGSGPDGPDRTSGILTGDPSQDEGTIAILLDCIADVSSHMSLDVVLQAIVSKSIEVTQAERAMLLLGDSLESLTVRLAQDSTGKDLGKDLVFSKTVVGKCLEDGSAHRSVVNSDQEALELGQSVYNLKLRAVMASPLNGKNGRIGVIYVDSTAVRREFSQRDLELFGALSAQLAIALENARLHADSLEKVRLEKDVEIAHRIQQHLLAPVPDDHPGLDIAVRFRAADQASGDAYDVVPLSDGRIVVMIGDVTGHGVGAALLTHAAQAALRSYLELIDDISEVATRLNERLVAGVEAGNFMSVLMVMIDREQRMFYVNAGHPGLIVVRNGEIEEHAKTGMVMGVVEGQAYEARGPIQLEPGDVLLLRTDGIDEAMNEQREPFGAERLYEVVRTNASSTADQILGAIDDATAAHAGSHEQEDDFTAISVRVLPR